MFCLPSRFKGEKCFKRSSTKKPSAASDSSDPTTSEKAASRTAASPKTAVARAKDPSVDLQRPQPIMPPSRCFFGLSELLHG